jgi:hypothetical protein
VLVELEARTVVARVLGSVRTPYTVNVAAPVVAPGVLRVACTCPMGRDRVACKHVFATLVVLDHRRADLELSGGPVRVEVVAPWLRARGAHLVAKQDADADDALEAEEEDDEPDDDDDEDIAFDEESVGHDEDDADLAFVEGIRPRRSTSSMPAVSGPVGEAVAARGRGDRPLGWSRRLESLDRAPAAPHRVWTGGRKTVTEFHVEAWPLNAGGEPLRVPAELSVRTFQRVVRNDGTLGVRSTRTVRRDGQDASATASDARALAALVLGTPIFDPREGYYIYSDEQRRYIVGTRVAAPLADRILPALASSGRLGWLQSGAERQADLHPLRWDADAPFALTLALRFDDGGRGATVSGWLARGDDRVALASLAVVFGAGYTSVGDRLVRAEPGSELARWWAIAGATPMTVPVQQLGAFMEQLSAVARLPVLELDPRLGWQTEVRVPVPHLRLQPRPDGGYAAQVAAVYGTVAHSAGGGSSMVVDRVEQMLYPVDARAEAAFVEELHRRLPPGQLAHDAEVPAASLRDLVHALAAKGWEICSRASASRSPSTSVVARSRTTRRRPPHRSQSSRPSSAPSSNRRGSPTRRSSSSVPAPPAGVARQAR